MVWLGTCTLLFGVTELGIKCCRLGMWGRCYPSCFLVTWVTGSLSAIHFPTFDPGGVSVLLTSDQDLVMTHRLLFPTGLVGVRGWWGLLLVQPIVGVAATALGFFDVEF